MMRQFELVERVKGYDPSADEDALNRAYVFSMKAHGAQLRASGDPYFSHPVEVAGILAGMKLDAASIITGLLHDTVEDTVATLEDIERLFGPDIAKLVDGVTKLSRLELQSDQTKQAENFRKLVLAMSEDIRVLLVKLADRLHNMRTLRFIRDEEKRRRIARETMEIYAPLAERIGMHEMKDELEDLAFSELYPDARQSIIARLAFLRAKGGDLVERIMDELNETLRNGGLQATVSGREKTAYSVWLKMQNKNVGFEQLSDIMAFRVVVDTVEQCYHALGVVHSRYPVVPGRFKDYISTPKPNNYSSLHTGVIGPQRQRIEMQIRTREMHEVAELGVAAHWVYKQGAPRTEGRQYRWLRDLLDIITSKAQTPSPTWERFVVTGKARARIRRFIRTQQRQQYLDLGKAILQKAFRNDGHEFQEKALGAVLKAFTCATVEDLYVAVGEGLATGREVVHALHPPKADAKPAKVITLATARGKKAAENAVPIRGLIPGMALHFAGCCHPLPGDRIVGIVTTGKGVTIHTIDCDALANFADTPERWLDVAWTSKGDDAGHVGRINVTLGNEPGSLGSLTTVIGKHHGNITNLKITNRSADFFEILVDIEVTDVRHLTNIIAALRATPVINSVERARG